MDRRGTRGFRAGLKAALPAWRAEGLIDEAAAARLTERHGLADPALEPLGLLPVYVLSALLAGAGVASLIAWHWDELGKALQVAIVFGLVIGAHLGGDRLRRAGNHPLLGEAVTLLGSLLFGAGIGLMAQIFQVSGPWYGLFGGFALGALGGGLLLGSGTTMMAASLAGVGLWASGWSEDHHGLFGLFVPYLAATPFLLAAWVRRSAPLLIVTSLALGCAAMVTTSDHFWQLPGLLLAAGLMAWPLAARPDDQPMARAAAGVARLAFLLLAFDLTFRHDAETFISGHRYYGGDPLRGFQASALAGLPATILLVLGLARRRDGTASTAGVGVAAGLLLSILLALRFEVSFPLAIAANVALVMLAALRVWTGLSEARRWPFWEGVALGTALIIARFFEIEQLLWLKGLGFIACAAAVGWGAVQFERRRQEVRHAG